MADRWELPKERSVDVRVSNNAFKFLIVLTGCFFLAVQELKNRYYAVCRALAANRPAPEVADPAEKEKADKARQDTVASFSFDISGS